MLGIRAFVYFRSFGQPHSLASFAWSVGLLLVLLRFELFGFSEQLLLFAAHHFRKYSINAR